MGAGIGPGILARRTPEGAFVHLGRNDSQVQVRGNRVELIEIEHTLTTHPQVRQAVVTWSEGRLDARVELERRAGEPPPNLRDFLAERLPAFMVPNRITTTHALPRTPAGKADRLALRVSSVIPDPISATLAAAWRSVLGLADDPSDGDDFFALGGDSIRALEVLDRLRAEMGIQLRPLTLYRQRRFGDLCDAVRLAAEAGVETQVGRTSTEARTRPGLSSVQRGFYLAQLETGRSPTWAAQIPLDGRLEPAALQAALDLLVERHPLLRTRFVRTGSVGALEAVREAEMTIRCPIDELGDLSPAARELALSAAFEEATATQFDPGKLPLLSIRASRLSSTRHVLTIASHHIIADAWSSFVLLSELCAAHDALARGEAAALPERPADPLEVLGDEPAARPTAAAYWRQVLTDLPQDPAPAEEARRHATFRLDRAVLEGLRSRARALGTTPFALVLGAFATELGAARPLGTSTEELVVATAVSGRDTGRGASARVVGPLARAIPIRLRAPYLPADVSAALSEALTHADVPASTLAAAAGPDGRARVGRFFMSWLNPSAVPPLPSQLQLDWSEGRFHFEAGATRTELMLGAMPHEEGLALHLHGGALVDRVGPALVSRLSELARRPDAALVVYPPAGFPVPMTAPLRIERVDCSLGTSELVLLPVSADRLAQTRDLSCARRGGRGLDGGAGGRTRGNAALAPGARARGEGRRSAGSPPHDRSRGDRRGDGADAPAGPGRDAASVLRPARGFAGFRLHRTRHLGAVPDALRSAGVLHGGRPPERGECRVRGGLRSRARGDQRRCDPRRGVARGGDDRRSTTPFHAPSRTRRRGGGCGSVGTSCSSAGECSMRGRWCAPRTCPEPTRFAPDSPVAGSPAATPRPCSSRAGRTSDPPGARSTSREPCASWRP